MGGKTGGPHSFAILVLESSAAVRWGFGVGVEGGG